MANIKSFDEYKREVALQRERIGLSDTLRVELPLCYFGCLFVGDKNWTVLNDNDGYVYGKVYKHFVDNGMPQIIWDIDINRGEIKGWKGNGVSFYFKVVDRGIYSILSDGVEVKRVENEYVPDFLQIDDEGYGDYLCFTVDSIGRISGWNRKYANAVISFFK